MLYTRQQQLEKQVATTLNLMQEQERNLAEQVQLSERRQTQLMHQLQEQRQQQIDGEVVTRMSIVSQHSAGGDIRSCGNITRQYGSYEVSDAGSY